MSELPAELDGRPLLEHALRAQCGVLNLTQIVVVLGAQAGDLMQRVEFSRAEPVLCADWRRGQAASLRCGIRALHGASKVVVTLGDEPTSSVELLARFLDQPAGTRAAYRGRPGHPVVLGPEQIRSVARLTDDRGARELLPEAATIECRVDVCGSRRSHPRRS